MTVGPGTAWQQPGLTGRPAPPAQQRAAQQRAAQQRAALGPRPAVLVAAVLLWLAAVGAWMVYALRYETSAAETLPAPTHVSIERSQGGPAGTPELVMFVHPQCPCSRASLHELERLMTRCKGRMRSRIVFVRPATCPPGWERSDLWDAAVRIPNARVQVDPGGVEAHRFAARASGEAFLIMPDGRVAFHGGLTAGRGHEGDNLGCDAVADILAGRTPLRTETPVFGCGLHDGSSGEGGP